MDDGGSQWSWLITVVFLVMLAMFFAITETAYASVSRTRLRALSEKGDIRAKRAVDITNHFERAITTILICTNIVHLAAASIVTVNATKIWGVSAVSLSTIVFTLVIFFFGEMMPKSIARKYNESISLSTASLLSFFMTLLSPVSSLLSAIGNGASKLFKEEGEVSVTEDELYDIIEDMTKEGTLDEEQGDLISSAIQFQDVEVSSILTSRVDLVALDVDTDQEEILKLIKEENHSRIPVYDGTIDNIIGILQIRKYMKTYLAKGEIKDLRELLDKPFFVYQTAKIDDVLATMSKEKLNIAVVTDNFGGTLGIISVEDILEELVGEIWDEDDDAEENIIEMNDGTYSVNANSLVTSVMDELDVNYDEETEEKINNKLMSELAFETFSSIPREGDTFIFLNTLITVQMMEQNRIVRLKVKILDNQKKEDTE